MVKCDYCYQEGHIFGMDCPEYKKIHEEAEAARKKWNDEHASCPKCGSEEMGVTLAGPIYVSGEPYEDNVNHAFCSKCDWKGMVKDLKPKK